MLSNITTFLNRKEPTIRNQTFDHTYSQSRRIHGKELSRASCNTTNRGRSQLSQLTHERGGCSENLAPRAHIPKANDPSTLKLDPLNRVSASTNVPVANANKISTATGLGNKISRILTERKSQQNANFPSNARSQSQGFSLDSTCANGKSRSTEGCQLKGHCVFLARSLKPRKLELNRLIRNLSGIPVDIFDRSVTLLIIEKGLDEGTPECRKAQQLKISIKEVEWLTSFAGKDYEKRRTRSFLENFRDFQRCQKRKSVLDISTIYTNTTPAKRSCLDSSTTQSADDTRNEVKRQTAKKAEKLEELLSFIESDVDKFNDNKGSPTRSSRRLAESSTKIAGHATISVSATVLSKKGHTGITSRGREEQDENKSESSELVLNPIQHTERVPKDLPVMWDSSKIYDDGK